MKSVRQYYTAQADVLTSDKLPWGGWRIEDSIAICYFYFIVRGGKETPEFERVCKELLDGIKAE